MTSAARLVQALKNTPGHVSHVPGHLPTKIPWAELASSIRASTMAASTPLSAPSGSPAPQSTPASTPKGVSPLLRQDLTPLLEKWCSQVLGHSSHEVHCSLNEQGKSSRKEDQHGGYPKYQSEQYMCQEYHEAHPPNPYYHHQPMSFPKRLPGQDHATSAAIRLVEELSRSAGNLTFACHNSTLLHDPEFQGDRCGDGSAPGTSNGHHESLLSPCGSEQVVSVALPNPHARVLNQCGVTDAGVAEEGPPSIDSQTQECSIPGNHAARLVARVSGWKFQGLQQSGYGMSERRKLGVEDGVPEKKLRRLVSNRASAKRSRKRRMDRLQELEVLSVRLRQDTAESQNKLSEANTQLHSCEDENRKLKKELQKLKGIAEAQGKWTEHREIRLPKRRRCGDGMAQRLRGQLRVERERVQEMI